MNHLKKINKLTPINVSIFESFTYLRIYLFHLQRLSRFFTSFDSFSYTTNKIKNCKEFNGALAACWHVVCCPEVIDISAHLLLCVVSTLCRGVAADHSLQH